MRVRRVSKEVPHHKQHEQTRCFLSSSRRHCEAHEIGPTDLNFTLRIDIISRSLLFGLFSPFMKFSKCQLIRKLAVECCFSAINNLIFSFCPLHYFDNKNLLPTDLFDVLSHWVLISPELRVG